MGKKTLIILGLIIIVAAAFYTYKKTAKAPTRENQVSNQPENNAQTPPAATSDNPRSAASAEPASTTPPKTNAGGGTFSGGEESASPDIQVKEIVYDGSNFIPGSVDIKVGDYVIFRNNGNTDFWPASAPHPTHTDYPEFDAKQSIAPGGKYQFQFMKAGNWKFHDHLNPSARGAVNVIQ